MRRLVLGACLVLAAALTPVATGSQLIDRNATHVSLQVNAKGEALITYKTGSKLKRVLAWGAMNAIPPNKAKAQVKLRLDYAGGWGKYHSNTYYLNFRGSCLPYDGPALAWKVTACKAPDGSYWALQSWQRALPNYGLNPTPTQAVWELRLSHWTNEIPILDIKSDWSYHRFDQLFGTYTYGGVPVFGFHSTSAGVPLDTYGRNIYLDTFNSSYGSGWKRENSFLTHTGHGSFCYGFYPHGSHPVGHGTQYRATAEGPGVAPDVMWQGAAPGPFDAAADAAANDAIKNLGDPHCRPN
jgi:hypothetical protein